MSRRPICAPPPGPGLRQSLDAADVLEIGAIQQKRGAVHTDDQAVRCQDLETAVRQLARRIAGWKRELPATEGQSPMQGVPLDSELPQVGLRTAGRTGIRLRSEERRVG